MPRNVVTLTPRLLALPTRRNRETRERIESFLVRQYRARVELEPYRIKIDFPMRVGRRPARTRVSGDLDRTDPRWRRVFVLYPRESSLRERA
jgi:hypothetical protein